MKEFKNYSLLFSSFFVYSVALLFSKFASENNFVVNFGISLMFIGVYAILWQLSLKNMDLNIAYSLKSISIIFTIIFGVVFFNELITIKTVFSVVLIIIGMVMILR